jgi:UDP-N-acetylglucosamine:LPS N-acetylglucosamine transferase
MSDPDPVRILILTADAGFGHRSAANAVAAALQERYGDQVSVEIANPLSDKRVPVLLRDSQSDYDKLVRIAPKFYNLGYELSDGPVPAAIIDGALTVMLHDALRAILRRTQPDAIVATFPLYQAPLRILGQLRRTHIPLLTVVTDLATIHSLWFHPAADCCLVPTPGVRNQALKAELSDNRIEIVGIPVHPRVAHAAAHRDRLRAELELSDDRTTLLAVGSKRVGHLLGVLRLLNHSALPISLLAVAGGDDTLFGALEATDWHIPVHIYNYVDNLPDLMHAADIVVCKAGGLIVSESLAAGKPILLVDVLPGQEVGNAEHVVDGGAGVWAKEPAAALEALFHWLDHDRAELKSRATAAQALGRPNAAFEIAQRAWEAACRGPQPARLTDLESNRLVAWLKSLNLSSEG